MNKLTGLIKKYPKLFRFGLLMLVFTLLWILVPAPDVDTVNDRIETTDYDNANNPDNPLWQNPLWRLPPLIAWFPSWINDTVEFFLNDWFPIESYNEELEDTTFEPLLLVITRAFSTAVLVLINLFRDILLGGIETIVAFTSWDWIDENPWATWPALPWTVVLGGLVLLAYKLKGLGLALFAGLSTLYIAIFGQWEPAMETISFILVAAPISILLGMSLGIWAYRSKMVEKILYPFLNVAQTMPHFSYLVPITVLFGVGDHAGAIAIVIFATPPMVRLTLLGLKSLPKEIIEAGLMNGCNQFQLMFKVLIPTARRDILIGVNQVIMECLAMAVIASFIGAKGLGYNLLLALNQLRIGKALEQGICITLIAILLDKLSLAWANKQKDYLPSNSFYKRNRYGLIFAGISFLGCLLAYLGTYIFTGEYNYLYLIPHNKGLTTENFWQSGVDWILDTFFYSLKGFNEWLIVEVLVPMKQVYLGVPVSATLVLLVGIGYIVGGIRSALIVLGFTLFIALTEWWDRALITAYLITISVLVSSTIGILAGILCAQNRHTTKIILIICDTFQTFPSFIYLIPVIMLFGVTDTSVLIAVIVSATVPAARYTVEGLNSIAPSLHEAGTMSGVNRFQRFFQIELPLAFPHIMLGVNQTMIFALFMVIIAAFIGTDDLGQLILKALSDRQGIGNGLVLGLCVAFIGLTVDHLIVHWSNARKKMMGLD